MSETRVYVHRGGMAEYQVKSTREERWMTMHTTTNPRAMDRYLMKKGLYGSCRWIWETKGEIGSA